MRATHTPTKGQPAHAIYAPVPQIADARINRLELLLWSIYRDGNVHGVLWSQETDRLLVEMQRARVLEPVDATTP